MKRSEIKVKKSKKRHDYRIIFYATVILAVCTVLCFALSACSRGDKGKQEKEAEAEFKAISQSQSLQPNIEVDIEDKVKTTDADNTDTLNMVDIKPDGTDDTANKKTLDDTPNDISKSENNNDTANKKTSDNTTNDITNPENDDKIKNKTSPEPDTKSNSTSEDLQSYPEPSSSYNAGDIIDKSLLNTVDIDKYFSISNIVEGDAIYSRINGKSYVKNDDISLSSLRYLKIPHYDFGGNIRIGEMIVNESIAEDVISIFKGLFQAGYQIESMRLIDDYWMGDGDSSDTNSVEHNNTSAFCYRKMTGGKSLSNHAYGKAVDINPQQNPYVSYKTGVPVWDHTNANDYIDRETGLPHVITHSDLAYELFRKYGFSWGGDWKNIKDYQHFEHK